MNVNCIGYSWFSIKSVRYVFRSGFRSYSGRQEPGTNDEIQQFCLVNYGVSFPVLAKIDVNGDKADPVYKYLKGSKSGFLGLSRIKYGVLLLSHANEQVEFRMLSPKRIINFLGEIPFE